MLTPDVLKLIDKAVSDDGLTNINYSLKELLKDIAVSLPYKVYIALMSQSGVDAPVATMLENTMGGAIVWEYVADGSFRGSLAGESFPIEKTALLWAANNGLTFPISLANNEDGTLGLFAASGANMYFNYIEIRVYP